MLGTSDFADSKITIVEKISAKEISFFMIEVRWLNESKINFFFKKYILLNSLFIAIRASDKAKYCRF